MSGSSVRDSGKKSAAVQRPKMVVKYADLVPAVLRARLRNDLCSVVLLVKRDVHCVPDCIGEMIKRHSRQQPALKESGRLA